MESQRIHQIITNQFNYKIAVPYTFPKERMRYSILSFLVLHGTRESMHVLKRNLSTVKQMKIKNINSLYGG